MAQEMLEAALAALPTDIAVCAAAVSDWHVAHVASPKIKKTAGAFDTAPDARWKSCRCIHGTLFAQHPTARPSLVVGFAAETHDVLAHARDKRSREGCRLDYRE